LKGYSALSRVANQTVSMADNGGEAKHRFVSL